MKPSNVRDKIKRIKDQLALENICIKHELRNRDRKNYKERITKQQTIIDEARRAIAKIRHQRKKALAKISKIKQRQRHERKELKILENYEKIKLLKKMDKQLRTMTKEMHDGEKHSDTQA